MKILIIDDELAILETVGDILRDEDYEVFTAASAEEGSLQMAQIQPDLILLDIWLDDMDGISFLKKLGEENRLRCPVVMMSGHGTIQNAVEATKLGAYDFLEKPISMAKLLVTVEKALQFAELKAENQQLKEKINPPLNIIGRSKLMQELRKKLENLAAQTRPLLITGPTGSGKAYCARHLHQRRGLAGQFIYVNTALIDENSLAPLVEQSENGTLFINEISELSPLMQEQLSHLMEQHSYVFPDGERPVQLTLICASRQPLAVLREKLERKFLDLLVSHLEVPGLSQHSDDVPELLDHYSQLIADQEQLPYRHFSTKAQNYLRQQQWLGNCRELKSLVQRLLIDSDKSEISEEEAREAFAPSASDARDELWAQVVPRELSFRDARDMFERHYLLEQFRRCNGNIAQLSQLVGMDRTNLYRKLRTVQIEPTEKPKAGDR